MNIIQKYTEGGGLGVAPLYYTPLTKVISSMQDNSAGSSTSADEPKDSNGGDDKGLFSKEMIKLMTEHALHSDLVKFLLDTLSYTNLLFDRNNFDFASANVSTLSLLVGLNTLFNLKKLYEEGLDVIKETKSGADVAVAPNNNGIFVLRDNKLQMISVGDLKDNERPLTNLEIAQIREDSPSVAYSTNLSLTMSNATSMELIRKTIDNHLSNIANNTNTSTGYVNPYKINELALNYLKSINIQEGEINGMSLNQLYKITATNTDSQKYINGMLLDLVNTLPENQITLLKVRAKQLNTDIGSILVEYISKRLKNERSIVLTTEDLNSSKKRGSRGDFSSEDLKLTLPQRFLEGLTHVKPISMVEGTTELNLLGTEAPLTTGKGTPLGTTAFDKLKTSDYASILDFKNVSMGGNFIDDLSLSGILVLSSNIVGAYLPAISNDRGQIKPDFENLDKLSRANRNLLILGINLKDIASLTPEQILIVNNTYAAENIPAQIKDGKIQFNNYVKFAIIRGMAGEDILESGDLDINSKYCESVDSSLESLYKLILEKTSTFEFNDLGDIYKANIYIPIILDITMGAPYEYNLEDSRYIYGKLNPQTPPYNQAKKV